MSKLQRRYIYSPREGVNTKIEKNIQRNVTIDLTRNINTDNICSSKFNVNNQKKKTLDHVPKNGNNKNQSNVLTNVRKTPSRKKTLMHINRIPMNRSSSSYSTPKRRKNKKKIKRKRTHSKIGNASNTHNVEENLSDRFINVSPIKKRRKIITSTPKNTALLSNKNINKSREKDLTSPTITYNNNIDPLNWECKSNSSKTIQNSKFISKKSVLNDNISQECVKLNVQNFYTLSQTPQNEIINVDISSKIINNLSTLIEIPDDVTPIQDKVINLVSPAPLPSESKFDDKNQTDDVIFVSNTEDFIPLVDPKLEDNNEDSDVIIVSEYKPLKVSIGTQMTPKIFNNRCSAATSTSFLLNTTQSTSTTENKSVAVKLSKPSVPVSEMNFKFSSSQTNEMVTSDFVERLKNLEEKLIKHSMNTSVQKNAKVCSAIGSNIYNPSATIKKGLRLIVIDGSNVAIGHSNGRYFSVEGLKICIDYFLNRGHEVKAFVPQYRRRHGQCSNHQLLENLAKANLVIFTPSRELQNKRIVPYDDRFIVQCAAERGGVIVSNDNYRDLLQENPYWRETIEQRLLMWTWCGDMIMFPVDPCGRGGPSLDKFLRF